MDHGPSFSIGVSQINSSNVNRTYGSDGEKWVENRSKLLHDTLAMKDQSNDKSKTKVEKTSKKRERKAAPVISRPPLPKDFTTSTAISSGTQEAIDTLIFDLEKLPIPTKSVSAVNPQELTGSHNFLSNSQLPTDIPITKIVVRSDSKIPLTRNMIP
uniref:Ulp1 protease family, C-terminal catalytic domain containing protein n=1 Tax=Solanum tuberosum TaxID=4113 RepID=M1DR47_SOLTU